MTEMIITSQEYEIGSIIETAISETEKYIRQASYYIKAEAGSTEGGEKIYKAIKIKELAPIKKQTPYGVSQGRE